MRLEEHVEGGRLVWRQIPILQGREPIDRVSYGELEFSCTTLPRKASNEKTSARTKTDTGRRGENPKVRGKTLVKELGKMPP